MSRTTYYVLGMVRAILSIAFTVNNVVWRTHSQQNRQRQSWPVKRSWLRGTINFPFHSLKFSQRLEGYWTYTSYNHIRYTSQYEPPRHGQILAVLSRVLVKPLLVRPVSLSVLRRIWDKSVVHGKGVYGRSKLWTCRQSTSRRCVPLQIDSEPRSSTSGHR